MKYTQFLTIESTDDIDINQTAVNGPIEKISGKSYYDLKLEKARLYESLQKIDETLKSVSSTCVKTFVLHTEKDGTTTIRGATLGDAMNLNRLSFSEISRSLRKNEGSFVFHACIPLQPWGKYAAFISCSVVKRIFLLDSNENIIECVYMNV